MTDIKCDYCKHSLIEEEIYRIRVQIPCLETKYWMDGIARIGLCQKCYESGKAINELKTHFLINFAEDVNFEVKIEPRNLYDTFEEFNLIDTDMDIIYSMVNDINLNIWLYLLKSIMNEILNGNTIKIIKLMEVGMLSMDY